LVDALRPGYVPDHWQKDPKNALANATEGIDTAFTRMGVPKLVMPDEMTNPKIDEHAMMTYISQFRDLPDAPPEQHVSELCSAHGPGLVEGIAGQDAKFTIEVPVGKKPKLEVIVEGPKNKAVPVITDNGNSTYGVVYKPDIAGQWKVHVLADGKHIPGSIFLVDVLEDESLGGEGKILVFYSTTSSTNQKTRPLQALLEKKNVHLRPDFEPWIPVDVLTRDERETVFRKAGTRTLPIVYIDDVYIGSYDRIFELEAEGYLDKLLKYKEQGLNFVRNNTKAETKK